MKTCNSTLKEKPMAIKFNNLFLKNQHSLTHVYTESHTHSHHPKRSEKNKHEIKIKFMHVLIYEYKCVLRT